MSLPTTPRGRLRAYTPANYDLDEQEDELDTHRSRSSATPSPRVTPRWRGPPALKVSVVGSMGSGKTALIAALREAATAHDAELSPADGNWKRSHCEFAPSTSVQVVALERSVAVPAQAIVRLSGRRLSDAATLSPYSPNVQSPTCCEPPVISDGPFAQIAAHPHPSGTLHRDSVDDVSTWAELPADQVLMSSVTTATSRSAVLSCSLNIFDVPGSFRNEPRARALRYSDIVVVACDAEAAASRRLRSSTSWMDEAVDSVLQSVLPTPCTSRRPSMSPDHSAATFCSSVAGGSPNATKASIAMIDEPSWLFVLITRTGIADVSADDLRALRRGMSGALAERFPTTPHTVLVADARDDAAVAATLASLFDVAAQLVLAGATTAGRLRRLSDTSPVPERAEAHSSSVNRDTTPDAAASRDSVGSEGFRSFRDESPSFRDSHTTGRPGEVATAWPASGTSPSTGHSAPVAVRRVPSRHRGGRSGTGRSASLPRRVPSDDSCTVA